MGANTRRRNSQRPDRPSPRPNQLQLAEYICWVSSALGTLVASTSMQFAYAGVPLSLSLLLNLANRRRIEISTHQRTMNAVVRVQQQFTQDLVALNDRIQFIAQQHIQPSNIPASRSPLLTQSQQRLQQLQAAQASIHSQSQMRIRDLEDFKLIYQELVNLQEQHRQVYESLAATIDYLNDSPLPHRVDELEQEIQQLHRELHQMSEQLTQSLALTVAGQEAVAQHANATGLGATGGVIEATEITETTGATGVTTTSDPDFPSPAMSTAISTAVATFPNRTIADSSPVNSSEVLDVAMVGDRELVQLQNDFPANNFPANNFPVNDFLGNDFLHDATVTFIGRDGQTDGDFARDSDADLTQTNFSPTEITPDFDPALLAELDAALDGEFASDLDQVFVDDVAEDLTESLLNDAPFENAPFENAPFEDAPLSNPAPQPLPPTRPNQPLSLPLEVLPSVRLSSEQRLEPRSEARSTGVNGVGIVSSTSSETIDPSPALVEAAPISPPPIAPISFEVLPRTDQPSQALGDITTPGEATATRTIVAPLLPEVRPGMGSITPESATIAPATDPQGKGNTASSAVSSATSSTNDNAIMARPGKLHHWRCVQTLTDHGDWVSDLLIDPSGNVLVSASFDRTIQFWNLATGEMLNVLSDHASPVCALALSAEQGWLVSGSWDRTVKIWDFSRQELLETLVDDSGTAGSVRSLAVSPNGRFVASGWFDRTIALWDVNVTPQRRRVTVNACGSHLGHEGRVDALAFSPDGELLASASADGTVKIWGIDSNTGELSLLHTIAATTDPINAIRFSQDGAQLVGANRNHSIYLWDVETATLQHQLTGHTGSVTSLAMHPDGSTLISGSADGTVWFWDVRTGSAIGMLSEMTDAVMSVTVGTDGRVVVSGSADGTIKVWRNVSLA